MDKLVAINAVPKTGQENLSFHERPVDYSLLDFWRWSVSDILSNATRGRFAEFVVGSAIGLNPEDIRNEWDAYDLISTDGIKIEIKSAAYIQSWKQNDYSKILFSIKPARAWDSENGEQGGEPKRHADIYVFCLLKHKNQLTIDPLKLEQWDFYVVPTIDLDNYKRSQTSISINSLQKIIKPVTYSDLNSEIERAFKRQKSDRE